MRRIINYLLLALVVSLSGALAFGQGVTGSITGVITDPTGAAIPTARVVAHNVETGAQTTGVIKADGSYTIANLPPGEYSLDVSADGFRRTTTAPQRVTVAGIIREDVALEIGQVTESVNVETHATQVNTTDSQLGAAIIDIPNLPILSGANGRDPLDLAAILPGVTPATGMATSSGAPFSVNGARAQSANYLLDGGDDNDTAINTPQATTVISPNALSEFRLITGSFDAQYGRNSGAVFEVNTKSGTNEYHGVASETFRNTILNATPFFQNSVPGGTTSKFDSGLNRKPQWNTNDWDVNLGGPIQKDKTFFFVSYLGFRRRQGEASAATVPSLSQRAMIDQYGTPAAVALLNLIPAPSSGNTLFSSPTDALNRDQGLVRVDHYFTQNHELSATYFIELSNAFAPFAFGGGPIPGFGETDLTNTQNAVLRDAYTFSPTLFNEARISFHRLASAGVKPVNKVTPSSLGFNINPDDASAEGPPNVRISGFDQWGDTIQGPQSRFDDTFQYSDSVSWVHGKHDFKFGGEGRIYDQNQIFDFINNGILIIDGSLIENGVGNPIPGLPDALTDFANGYATDFAQNSAGRRAYRTHAINVYAQDNWKIRRNLTLNFGLRYEFNAPLVDLNNDVNTLRVGQQSTVFPSAPVGLVFPGDQGVSRSTYNADYKDFGPRVGFAWDVLGNGKLSVRSGAGIFYDAPITELTLQFLTSPPFAIQPNQIYTQYANPYPTALLNPTTNPFPFQPVRPGQAFDFTAVAPLALTVMDPHFRNPRSYNWNFQVQYQLPSDWLVSGTYVGTKGTALLNRRDIDPGLYSSSATTGNEPERGPLNLNNPQDAAYGGAVYGGVTDQLSDGNSMYNALQLSATKRFSHNFSMSHAFTWSHSIDDASGLRVASNPFCYCYDRGNSDFDVRYRYVASYIYQIPFMKDQKGFTGKLLGGWGLSGITTYQSGTPFDIVDSGDRSLTGAGDDRPDYVGGNLVFYNPRSDTAVAGLPNSYFNGTGGGTATGAGNPNFARVGSGSSAADGAGFYGTLGRNVFHGPGMGNWDLSAFKNFRIGEKRSFEFRAQFFNAFNHTQFGNPVSDIASPAFGQVQTTQVDPRRIQFQARLVF